MDASLCLERVPCLLLHLTAGQAEALGLACGSGRQLGMAVFPTGAFLAPLRGQ